MRENWKRGENSAGPVIAVLWAGDATVPLRNSREPVPTTGSQTAVESGYRTIFKPCFMMLLCFKRFQAFFKAVSRSNLFFDGKKVFGNPPQKYTARLIVFDSLGCVSSVSSPDYCQVRGNSRPWREGLDRGH